MLTQMSLTVSFLLLFLLSVMASVAKHPKSPYWYACYTARDGRQLKRSTKSTERRQALKLALALEAAEDKAREGVLTTTQLQKILSDVSEEVTGAKLTPPTIEAYLREWLAGIRVRLKAHSAWIYENTVNRFVAHLGEVARRPVTSLASSDVEGFITARLKEGLAPRTVQVDLQTLNTAFKRAESYGVILKNPVAAVRPPKAESSQREVFTLEEIEKLLEAAPNLDWQTLILLGYFVGARLGDCARMKWENVRPEEGVIVYTQQKTGNSLKVPMHYHLIEHVLHLAQHGTEGYLCPSLADTPIKGASGLSDRFLRIVKQAGLDPMVVQGKGRRKFTRRSFHSLRHSFNSALANAGVPEDVRMRLTGHMSKSAHDRYTHLELDTLRQAVRRLPLMGTPKASPALALPQATRGGAGCD